MVTFFSPRSIAAKYARCIDIWSAKLSWLASSACLRARMARPMEVAGASLVMSEAWATDTFHSTPSKVDYLKVEFGAMIKLVDPDTELVLEISLPENLERALRIQIQRSLGSPVRDRFVNELWPQICSAISESLDDDLGPPTARQVRYAKIIQRDLGVVASPEVYWFRGSMSEFLTHYAPLHRSQA